ncbi:hypothetical protein [Amycolatopsis orientalis]|uniref:hypothetical protein n=1 Tax=Amycolatopsis orientalis TaxID=31958 RepID=UPI00055BC83F|nr:hypothetical protein [Amycolatopsis orientalis]
MTKSRRAPALAPDHGEADTRVTVRGRILLSPSGSDGTGRPRRRLLRLLPLGVAVVLGCLLAVGAWASPEPSSPPGGSQAAVAQQQPELPLPLPTVAPGDTCAPGSPDPTCHFPTGSPRPSVPATPLPPITELPAPESCFPGQIGCAPGEPGPAPTTSSGSPCVGEGCIPQPSSPAPSTPPGPTGPGADGDDPDCGITNIEGCINKAINAVFRELVKSALDPLLKLLGDTAFSTPTLDSLPGVTNLWNNSWLIVLACYSGLIMIGGIIVMSHESVQSRYSIKEIAPRLVISFIASMLSLFVIDKAIRLANALSTAVLSGGADPPKLGDNLTQSINGTYSAMASGGLFVILLQVVLVIAVIALLLVYVVRVIITLLLTVSAPLWVACHALPHTDSIARWGWRATGATLGIQVAQSLTLIVAVNTFLNGSTKLFSSVGGGLMMLFAVLGLLYILIKIPSWFLSATKLGGGGRSFLGGLVKAVIAAKTFGAIAGRSGGFGGSRAAGVATTSSSRGGTGRARVADPPWPPQPRLAPTPEAVNKRMQQHYDAERLHAAQQPRVPSQEPKFLQPGPQTTTRDPAVHPAPSGPPPKPEFSSAPRPAVPLPPSRGGGRRVANPRFQTANPSRRPGNGQAPARPVGVAAVPPHLRFKPAAPEPRHLSRPVTPATATPSAPVFRTPHPEPRPADARPRTPAAPPVAFRAPTPPPLAPAPKPSSRGGTKS